VKSSTRIQWRAVSSMTAHGWCLLKYKDLARLSKRTWSHSTVTSSARVTADTQADHCKLLFRSRWTFWVKISITQVRNQLGTPGVAKSFQRGAQVFQLRPVVFNYAQHIFPGGGLLRAFSRGRSETFSWEDGVEQHSAIFEILFLASGFRSYACCVPPIFLFRIRYEREE